MQFLAHRLARKKLGTLKAPKYSQPTLICSKNTNKDSNFAVFEIANNFIVGIQFLAHRLAAKKFGSIKTPQNTPKLPLT